VHPAERGRQNTGDAKKPAEVLGSLADPLEAVDQALDALV
jgi:hypothetical protein